MCLSIQKRLNKLVFRSRERVPIESDTSKYPTRLQEIFKTRDHARVLRGIVKEEREHRDDEEYEEHRDDPDAYGVSFKFKE